MFKNNGNCKEEMYNNTFMNVKQSKTTNHDGSTFTKCVLFYNKSVHFYKTACTLGLLKLSANKLR